MSKVWSHLVSEGTGRIRHLYHLWKLRSLVGRGHSSIRDIANRERSGGQGEIGARRGSESPPTWATIGANALMPVIKPTKERRCLHGHPMVFHTVPLPDHENMMILGCANLDCSNSFLTRLKDLARMYGIQNV